MACLAELGLKSFSTGITFENYSIYESMVLLEMLLQRSNKLIRLCTVRAWKWTILQHNKWLQRKLRLDGLSTGVAAWDYNLRLRLAVLRPLVTSWVWETNTSKISSFADKNYFTKQHAQLFLLRIVPHVNQVQKEPDWEYKAKIIKIVCIPEKSGLVHPTALCVFVHPCKRLSGKISG